jgi:four helix bundle protein
MFDFEKLDVYQAIKEQNVKLFNFLKKTSSDIDAEVIAQWKKLTLDILLNLAEGTGRITSADKRYYLTIARGSVFESVAILNLLLELGLVDEGSHKDLYDGYEKCSKMLLGMYRSYVDKI